MYQQKYRYPLNLQLFAEGDGGAAGGDGGQQLGDKTFTQADVDRIVSERLGRVKSQYADHEEIVQMVKAFGYEGATPAEIKAQLKAEMEGRQKQEELQDLKDEAKANGKDPELAAKIKVLEDQLSKLTKDKEDREKEVQARKAQEEAWNKQVSDFKEKYPDIDVDKLDENEKFVKFAKRSHPSLSLTEVYEDFMELASEAEKEALTKIKSNLDRSTASGRGKGDAEGGTYGLTPHQQKLARDNGMSLKEYADLLGHIKK